MSSLQRRVGSLTLDIPALIIGVQILLKAWEKAEAHHPVLAVFLFALGAAVGAGAFLTLWLEKRTEGAHGLFHLAEGVAIGLSAIVLLQGGRMRIPLILLFAGLCYVVVGLIELQHGERRARLARPLTAIFAVAFMVAAVVLAATTMLNDRSVWALFTAGLFAAVGIALLVVRRVVPPHAGMGARHGQV